VVLISHGLFIDSLLKFYAAQAYVFGLTSYYKVFENKLGYKMLFGFAMW